MAHDLEFLLLGPLEILAEGRPLGLRSPKQRALLTLLLLHANEVVASERLIEELWPEKPPGSTANLLQVYVSQLRKLLVPGRARDEPGPLVTQPPGYVLRVEPGRIDVVRFERLVDEGMRTRAGGDAERAVELLDEALGLWRGAALADVAYADFARTEIARLEELRLFATEERIDALLALGRHAALVGELEALVDRNPLRERLSGQLMLALYRSGRQAEALEAYSDARRRLVDELGIDPGPGLQRLERSILNHDPALDPPEAAAQPEPESEPEPEPEPAPPRRPASARKTVTVLFCEWVLTPVRGDAIDPEALEPVLERLGASVAGAVTRHGGSVEWTRDVEAIAVFGLPRVHEDDALRAVRAAVDLRAAAAASNAELERDFGVRVAVRIGLNTGQVIAGVAFASPSIGGASSIAARLGRDAAADEIRLADATRTLVRDACDAEPVTDGGAAGWRLVALTAGADAVTRRLSERIVGRRAELERLRRAFDDVELSRSAALVTVVGPGGIGKSHLARAFTTMLGDRCRVLVGRVAAYGAGSAFAPLADMVHEVGGDRPLDAVRARVAGEDDPDLITERIAAAIGLSDTGGGSETTLWAVRKLIEAMAREQPLVIVLDDLHWAEPTFLDLVDYVLDWTLDAPVLLLGLARPELLEERPAWVGGGRSISSLRLGPLAVEESLELVEQLLDGAELPPARAARIVEAAEGNPLFIEQMLAMQRGEDASDAAVAIPPTVQALLAARLDRLDDDERSVLEHASVMGKEFWRDALAEVTPERDADSLGRSLRALIHKQLIEPVRSALPAGDALRFRSLLIRDAVYETVPKRTRAVLHERVATWLALTVRGQATQIEEVLGYHLEQSFRYAAEVGPLDEHAREIGRAGAVQLAAAGRRAFARGDMSAAAALLLRAAALLPDDHPDRIDLLPVAGEALHEAGDFGAARRTLDEAIRLAEAKDDVRLHARARLVRSLVEASAGDGEPGEPFVAEAEAAAALFEREGDDGGLATALRSLAWAHGTAGRYGDAAEAARRAVEHAGRAGDDRQRARAATQYALAALHGPTPTAEAIARCRAIIEEVSGDRRSEGLVTSILGWLEAMRGDFDRARTLADRSRGILVDLGTSVLAASTSQESAQTELLAGDHAAAESQLRRDFEALTVLGERYLLSTVAADLAQALYAQGRDDEALEVSRTAEQLAAADDVTSQAFWRSVRAKVLARRGELDEALPLAEAAVELLRQTDDLVALSRALVDASEVLAACGRTAEARARLEEAIRLLEQKDNLVGAAHAARLLDGLPAAAGVSAP